MVLEVFKNGSRVVVLHREEIQAAGTVFTYCCGSTDIKLSAGDYIEICVYQSSGATICLYTGAGINYFNIRLVS